MTEQEKARVEELHQRRKELCDECVSLEQEVRMLDDEIEEIDKEIFRLELPPEERGE